MCQIYEKLIFFLIQLILPDLYDFILSVNISDYIRPIQQLQIEQLYIYVYDYRQTAILQQIRISFLQVKIMEKNQLFMTFEEFSALLGSWQKPLQNFIKSKTFQNIYKFVKTQYESGKKIYPPKNLIFNAFTTTPIQNIKVVIVGQDPYHQPKQAHGLCFSVMKPVPPPPSLKNMYKSLKNDPKMNFKQPKHGDLTKWAQQGVFLLNASLTVQDSKPNSHAKCGWQEFTTQVINIINKNCQGVVFLLWGKPAQQKAKNVNIQKHHVLKTTHPSPLSASQGFLTANHFSKCNDILAKMGKKTIDWNLDQ